MHSGRFFGVETDAALGFNDARHLDLVTVEDVNRRGLLISAGVLTGRAGLGMPTISRTEPASLTMAQGGGYVIVRDARELRKVTFAAQMASPASRTRRASAIPAGVHPRRTRPTPVVLDSGSVR